MPLIAPPDPDVYSVREIARAARVSARAVDALIQSAQVSTLGDGFLSEGEAVRAVRLLTGAPGESYRARRLLVPHDAPRVAALPFAASTVLHAAIAAAIALITALGLKGTVTEARVAPDRTRLVFLATPGPGGGGGGGGLSTPKPAARAELKGTSGLRSPVRTEPRPARVDRPTPQRAARTSPRPIEKPPDVEVAEPSPPVPPVTAPVAPAAADPRDQAGVLEAPAAAPPSQGSGSGRGSGAGSGTGMGQGQGAGVGDGQGGGTGGGPYRPGSGITPPGLLREVKPHYTEEGRRLGTEGDVVLEIVVRADGTVGDVTVLQRLGSGLDQRAVEAVRQWKFSPARRFGTPVDVLVEVAVEFKLR
jgi:periplasmic protein TonB